MRIAVVFSSDGEVWEGCGGVILFDRFCKWIIRVFRLSVVGG